MTGPETGGFDNSVAFQQCLKDTGFKRSLVIEGKKVKENTEQGTVGESVAPVNLPSEQWNIVGRDRSYEFKLGSQIKPVPVLLR